MIQIPAACIAATTQDRNFIATDQEDADCFEIQGIAKRPQWKRS
jgi:hypothetical protein